jgi:hypothetical protein
MILIRQAGAVIVLVTLTLSLQCTGMAALIGRARTSLTRDTHKLGRLRSAVLMVRFTTAIIVLHLFQILLWACFYRWLCFSLWESAFYFSTANYTTVGSSDVVLPRMWRTLGPVESMVGVLMCGLSASFLFAVVTRLVESDAGSQVNSRSWLRSLDRHRKIPTPGGSTEETNGEYSYLAKE